MPRDRVIGFSTAQVLNAVASGYEYGFEIMDRTGLPSGTVYPALSKLEQSGFVRSRWEDSRIARREKRPPRRSYELTEPGRETLKDTMRHYQKLRTLTVKKATT